MDNNIQQAIDRFNEALYQLGMAATKAVTDVLQPLATALHLATKYHLELKRTFLMATSEECRLAMKKYPKLKHLALHAKKRRVRKKNLKRLYKLGLRIESQR